MPATVIKPQMVSCHLEVEYAEIAMSLEDTRTRSLLLFTPDRRRVLAFWLYIICL